MVRAMLCGLLARPDARTVGTTTPPTTKVHLSHDEENIQTRREYDKAQPAGAAAVTLLELWKSNTSDDMPAPWRQTAGAGGSEFGKYKWFNVLKAGFKTPSEVPRFKLWQLALADHVVRVEHRLTKRTIDWKGNQQVL
jgi:hypothetical protein